MPTSDLTQITREEPRAERPLPAFPAEWTSLASGFLARVAVAKDEIAVRDTTGEKLTYAELLGQAAAIARVLASLVGESRYVGIMLPPGPAAAAVNVAVALMGKVAVNLNYGTNQAIVNGAIEDCKITHVVTAQRLMDKTKIVPAATLILADELKALTTPEVVAWVGTTLAGPPQALPEAFPGLASTLEDEATILFTSGSTSRPKGVILPQRSILTNIWAIKHQYRMEGKEVIAGLLTFAHALGYTGTLWAALLLGMEAVYHGNPLEFKRVCELVREHGVTIFVTSPTLMRMYLAKATREQFASVRFILLGSEKLKPELFKDIEDKLGKKPCEAFGSSELGPVATLSVNQEITFPDGRVVVGNRPGSVGLPVAGTAIKIVHIETGAVLPRGREHQGLIWVKGDQVMRGYLNRPEATAEAVVDGWYLSGDIGYLDADGFLFITDRLARFAKVGGEMVPMGTVEALIRELTGADELSVHVTCIPDDRRGERLVVFYTTLGGQTPDLVVTGLSGKIPSLWVPDSRDFTSIDALPVGSTGKVDMQSLKQLAITRAAKA